MQRTFAVAIGGAAGQGVATPGDIFAKLFARRGLHVNAYNAYQSIIRGGHTFLTIRTGIEEVRCFGDRIDLLIPLNQDSIDRHSSLMKSGSAVVYNSDTIKPRALHAGIQLCPLPVKQLSKGARLLLPVSVDGALFSTGDGHYAQGDGEVCVTAIEMGATCVVRFRVHRGEAERAKIRGPRFQRSDYFIDPRWAAPRRFIATMGMPVDEAGVNHGENLNLACRNAVLNMMALLQERGLSREQAYVLCSVAVDLRISNVVDVPNYVVSALLPEEIFQS